MKRTILATILLSLILLFSSSVFADSGKIMFFDQNGQNSSFNATDVKTLGLKANLTKSFKNSKF
ncbi:MAG: hypothetical protein ABFD50_19395, partial [Smithella sp.]